MIHKRKLEAIASANAGLDDLLAMIPDDMPVIQMNELVATALLENPNQRVTIGLLTAAICRLKELERL